MNQLYPIVRRARRPLLPPEPEPGRQTAQVNQPPTPQTTQAAKETKAANGADVTNSQKQADAPDTTQHDA